MVFWAENQARRAQYGQSFSLLIKPIENLQLLKMMQQRKIKTGRNIFFCPVCNIYTKIKVIFKSFWANPEIVSPVTAV